MLKKYHRLIGLTNKSVGRDNEESDPCSLIWLDSLVNISQENINVQKLLRSCIDHLKTFDNIDNCVEYIQSISNNERLIIIVSGRLGRSLTSRIHELRQVSSIYIYCSDKSINEQWSKPYKKIKDIVTKFDELIQKIRSERSKRNQNEVNEILPFVLSQQQSHFISSQLLIDILLQLPETKIEQNKLILLLKEKYHDTDFELKLIQDFEENYTSEKALDWYMKDSCIYRLLNTTIRSQNFDNLFLFRFFIDDVHQAIESKKCTSSVRVYRSQLLTREELVQLKNSIHHFISINTFFSTSICRELALLFLDQSSTSNELERVIFEIEADPSHTSTKQFCFIESNTYFRQTEEVLFTIGSIFRLNNLYQQTDGIWIIQLMSCADDDSIQFKEYFKPYKINDKVNLIAFGNLLRKLNQFNDAEKFFIRLLNEHSNDLHDIADCYFALGSIAREKKMYDISLDWHKKSLEIKLKILSEDNISLADSYNQIGEIYSNKSDYKQALAAYLRALNVTMQVYEENHVRVSNCYTNLGGIYQKQEDFINALDCYKKSLEIHQKHTSVDHPDLGIAYNNVAIIYSCLNQYDLALKHYEKALENLEKTLSPLDLEIAVTYCGLGLIYEQKSEFDKAYSFYEKTAVIYRQTLSSTHRDVIEIERHIQRISSKL
ncbi:hypothetical protein I4U23_007729 [Adineta vaga]|nr:hypothetical protein I4U23_007729 [Adineta vaga]